MPPPKPIFPWFFFYPASVSIVGWHLPKEEFFGFRHTALLFLEGRLYKWRYSNYANKDGYLKVFFVLAAKILDLKK